MRRAIRATGLRLLTVLLAVLVAAPVAAATPGAGLPTRSSRPSAPATLGPSFRESSRELRGGRRVVAGEVATHGVRARSTLDIPRLSWTPRAARGPQATTALLAAAPPSFAVMTTGPRIATPTFDGLSEGGPPTDREPPDPWVAVGPDHVVQVVNTAMRITDRQGQTPSVMSLAEFFDLPTSPVTQPSDPRIIYDSLQGRWFLVELSYDCEPGNGALYGHGYLNFAISETADPRAGWRTYTYVYADAIPDYPGVGTSTDKVVMSSNVFPFVGAGCTFGDLAGIDLMVLDWSQLKTAPNATALANAYFISGPNLFTFRPALQAPATDATVRGVVEAWDGADFNVGYMTISGNPVAGTVTPDSVTLIDLTADGMFEAYGVPPAPRQPGPDTVTEQIDGRPTDAAWQGGRLTSVATTDCQPIGDSEQRDCIRVSELLTTSGTRRQDFLLGLAGSDLYFGGIGLSGNGALHVTYTQSSTSENPSTYAVYQLPSDATNAVSAAELLRTGTAPYGGKRWGDYTGVAQDPQDPNVVWQTNEVSNGGWLTHISPLSTAIGSTFVPITPRRVLDTRPATQVGLTNRFAHGVARSWQVAGVLGIPADTVAVTGNVTVVGQTGAGFVSVTPRPTNTPTSSTMNFPLGDVRANNVTTPLGPDGKLSAVYISSAGKLTHLIFDVTGYFLATDSGEEYNTLTPARILDTRAGGLAGRLKRDVPRNFQVGGMGGVPVGAVAVTGNLTVTQQTASGYVSLTPSPTVNPPTSTINFPLGETRANGVTIPLSPTTGKVSAVYKSSGPGARTHLIFDVTGFYLDGASGLRYFPLNPGRRMDTRTTVLTGLTGRFQANTSRALDTAAHLGIPFDATAITGNLTVTQPNKAGYLALTPDFVNDPPTSTLNFKLGDTRANGITQRLNGSGDMSIWFESAAGGRVHVILDITGYFR